MKLVDRVAKHARLNWKASGIPEVSSPPFLILFINSIYNMKCEHCFYWQELNQRDDLTFDELSRLSNELGPIEILNLSGGEPFLRPAVCGVGAALSRVLLMPRRRAMMTFCTSMVPPGCARTRDERWKTSGAPPKGARSSVLFSRQYGPITARIRSALRSP